MAIAIFCAAAVAWAASTTEQKFPIIEANILYFGTPVALVSSLNEDGSTDLAPISSFWALGWTLILGLLTETKTTDNVRDTANA